MWLSLVYVTILFLTFTKGQFDSYEVKQIDLTPLHDAIIFEDISDIIKDFENSMSPHGYMFSGSESSEDIDNLLLEYQHYLDKAHKQRINYIEKSKGKNKVPLTRREKYTKSKQSKRNKYNDYFNNLEYSLTSLPENLFMSHNSELNVNNKPKFTGPQLDYNYKTPNILTQTNNEKDLFSLIPSVSNLNKPSCICKDNQIPCKCSCKQCFILPDSLPSGNVFIESFPKTSKYTLPNKINHFNEDKMNIRVKIDVQLPKILSELIHKYQNQDKFIEEGLLSKELISTNLPFPQFNFPIPIDVLGHKKMYNKHDDSALHKITIHKKKKSRLNNNSKKHTGKKIITFHSIKQDKPIAHNKTEENSRINKNNSMESDKLTEKPKLQTKNPQNGEMTFIASNDTLTEVPLKNINGSIETIYLTVNISKNNDNNTNESLKIENSIETDFVEKKNYTIVEPLRLKREAKNTTTFTRIYTNTSATTVMPQKFSRSIENYIKEAKKFNKSIDGDMELLYWPIETKNATLLKSKNITALILERETQKAKLNMTDDKIHSNRTIVLEHAIFGDVDWNDVDTVAPVFMSFVGKYVRGVLTFCSQSVCHSMKCSEKKCLHRICTPENRFNYKGHCTGNNDTDSVAAMESIMDLPSNIGFEIVDILQDKMLGKMYGKATLCILSKCSTFVASKKKFQRSKCTSKELSSLGHCPIVKMVKTI